ncbi:MAG: PepSY domain-containing protein [bacterium]
MKTKHLISTAIAGVIALSTVAFAATKHMEKNEVPALKAQMSAAKITLNNAITAAETHVQGKAVDAKLEDKSGKFSFRVEVLKADQIMDVTVDSRDGKILSAVADKDEHEGDHEEQD